LRKIALQRKLMNDPKLPDLLKDWWRDPQTQRVAAAMRERVKRLERELTSGAIGQGVTGTAAIGQEVEKVWAELEGLRYFLDAGYLEYLRREDDDNLDEEEIDPYE
jgi:hypothetical protein